MLTPEQRLFRADKLGSSDAAAVCGLDEYRNAHDVFLEKTGQVPSFEGNEHTERGRLLEPVLIQYAAERLGWKYLKTNYESVHPSRLLIANLDALSADDTEIVEAKSATDPDDWGPEGTDEVPDRVVVQVAHQFVCVPSARVAHVPVLLAGFRSFEFRMYRIERDDALCGKIEALGLAFMQTYVQKRVTPPGVVASLETLRRVRRVPNKVVPIADELVERYEAACKAATDAGKIKEKAQSYLLAALGDAEAGIGSKLVTYQEYARAGYTVEPGKYRKMYVKKAEKLKELVGAEQAALMLPAAV
jgi:putative phage-type endonuclease